MSSKGEFLRTLLLVSAAFSMLACGEKSSPEKKEANPEAQIPSASESAKGVAEFDPTTVPVTDKEVGVFPFFNTPEGFSSSKMQDLDFEEKYFFPSGNVRVVAGKYYHADVYGKEGKWNETLLIRSFDQKIRELGGVQVFDGSLPQPAREMIEKNTPRFVSDLYDPWPYRFRQYLIRTVNASIWIELGYGYNTQMVDLTVVQEGELKQTITQITADQISKDLQTSGKAVLQINFDTDRATLTQDGQKVVGEIATTLKRDSVLKLSIEGHTDDTGSAEQNQVLSLERAQSVVRELVHQGIASTRLKAAGFGAKRPLTPNTDEESRARNRRVELIRM